MAGTFRIGAHEVDKVLGHATLKPLHADDFLSFEVLSRNAELARS